ncbi:MAG: class I SAM-dependent methyltransferase [Patescibacteria group bacterium]
MLPRVYSEMILNDDSWYYAGKRAAIRAILKKNGVRFHKAVDLGCGTGGNANALIAFASPDAEYVGVEPHELPSRFPDALRSRIIRERLENVDLADIGGKSDLVMMIDALEHVDEDAGLSCATRLISDDGYLLISVPADMRLWSKKDEDCGHRKRYSPKELFDALERHGFSVLSWNRYFAFGYLPLLVSKHLVTSYFGPSGWGWLLRPIAYFEGWLGRWIRWPIGTGIICLAGVKNGSKNGVFRA